MIHKFLDHISITRKQFAKNQRLQDLVQGGKFFLTLEKPINYQDPFYNGVVSKKIEVGKALNVVCFDEDTKDDFFWNVFIYEIQIDTNSPRQPVTVFFEIVSASTVVWN